MLDVLRQGAKVGQPIILFRTSNTDAAEDFVPSIQGTTADFYAAGLVSAAVALHYGCIAGGNFPNCGVTGTDDPAIELPPSVWPDRYAVFDVASSSKRTMFAFGAICVSVMSCVVPLVAAMRSEPRSLGPVTFVALRPVHRDIQRGIGLGEHHLHRALGRRTHGRDHQIDLVGQQIRYAIGTDNLLELHLHAEGLGDHLAKLDVEARRLAVRSDIAERWVVHLRADTDHALVENILQISPCRRDRQRQQQQAQ